LAGNGRKRQEASITSRNKAIIQNQQIRNIKPEKDKQTGTKADRTDS
jgi:hypothetical protein